MTGNPREQTGTAFTRLIGTASGTRLFLVFLTPFLLVLAGLLLFFTLREDRRSQEAVLGAVRETARSLYEQIAVARLWNARHGGVYAEVRGDTRPNPYLDAPDRDIVTVGGKHYTKINPAYMTRQLSVVAAERSGNTFRIIGRKPLNPANAPDPWEDGALGEFERNGAGEITGIFTEDGSRVYRMVVPLFVEKPCLACHARQGYRAGDVKGGISIRVPLVKYDAIRQAHTRRTALSLAAVSALSVLFSALAVGFLSRRLSQEVGRRIERQKLATAMELAGATAHEMRQPMTVVHCMLSVLSDKARRHEQLTAEEIGVLHDQCARMNIIIEKLLRVTEYRTKEYTPGIAILDIDASCGKGPAGTT